MTRPIPEHTCFVAFAAALLCFISGCGGKGEPIRHYTVERPRPQHRMWAAMVTQSDRTWFFKVTGPNRSVQEQRDEFQQFLQTVRFEGGEPTWELPEGWKQRAGGELRFATLEVGSTGLELSVMGLPSPGTMAEGYLLSNINRWRGQLQLRPLAIDQLDAATRQLELDAAANLTAIVCEFEGNLGGGPGAMPSMAGPARPAGPAPREAEIDFGTPEGWIPAERSSSSGGITVQRAAVFKIGETSAEVSVTSLSAAAGDRLSNVNRWRRSIELPAVSAEELALEPIPFAEGSGDYTELIGADKAILGVIADRNGLVWFVKLAGPHDVAIKERESFKEFVASIRFKD